MNTTELPKNFQTELRALCIAYDNECGEYPENGYEGMSVFEFFLENNYKKSPTFITKHCEYAWNEMEKRIEQHKKRSDLKCDQ